MIPLRHVIVHGPNCLDAVDCFCCSALVGLVVDDAGFAEADDFSDSLLVSSTITEPPRPQLWHLDVREVLQQNEVGHFPAAAPARMPAPDDVGGEIFDGVTILVGTAGRLVRDTDETKNVVEHRARCIGHCNMQQSTMKIDVQIKPKLHTCSLEFSEQQAQHTTQHTTQHNTTKFQQQATQISIIHSKCQNQSVFVCDKGLS